jgi:hypothetical protein
MALKEKWVDKQDNVDDVLAEDINEIAHAVIGLENETLPTNPVVLADMTTTEQAVSVVVPLSDDVRKYSRLLITLTMKHYGTATSPSIMFFDTVTEDSYGQLTSIKGLFNETSATTVYLDVEFFANSILVRAAKKASYLSASEGVLSYVVSIANHFITADLVDAIRFSGAYMDTGAKIKVEGVPR